MVAKPHIDKILILSPVYSRSNRLLVLFYAHNSLNYSFHTSSTSKSFHVILNLKVSIIYHRWMRFKQRRVITARLSKVFLKISWKIQKSRLCLKGLAQLVVVSSHALMPGSCLSLAPLEILSAICFIRLKWITYMNLNKYLRCRLSHQTSSNLLGYAMEKRRLSPHDVWGLFSWKKKKAKKTFLAENSAQWSMKKVLLIFKATFIMINNFDRAQLRHFVVFLRNASAATLFKAARLQEIVSTNRIRQSLLIYKSLCFRSLQMKSRLSPFNITEKPEVRSGTLWNLFDSK